jgi:hypothetical protein
MNDVHLYRACLVKGWGRRRSKPKEPPTVTPGTITGKIHDARDLIGTEVRVERAGTVIRVGYMETATPSGELFWIRANGCEPRELFGTALGHTVVPASEPDQVAG